jgi:hypothetical protein
MVMPFIPLIAAAAGPLLAKALGPSGGGGDSGGGGGAAQQIASKPKALFQPDQIKTATDKYTTENTAKWNQILANMGAAGGTGGPNVTTQIGNQAQALGGALGKLNTESGYGTDPMANLDAIMKGVEGGIGPKYSLY